MLAERTGEILLMILLVAIPGPARAALVSFLDQEKLQVKVCDTLPEAAETLLKASVFDLVVADYRLGPGAVRSFIADFTRRHRGVTFIVIGAPLKAEADLLRSGALAVLGAGFSPQSAALQCLNIHLLIARPASPMRSPVRKTPADFAFGSATVSPARNLLKSKRAAPGIPLTRLQLALLQALRVSPGRTLDYEFLFHTVWRQAYRGSNGAIRECISTLRNRFRQAGYDLTDIVTTVHGVGYRYNEH